MRALHIKAMVLLLAAAGWFSATDMALAAGTPAGTVISNSATLNYTSGGAPQTATSNAAQTTVIELIDSLTVWQDAANVTVTPGTSSAVLTFTLVNTGNGVDSYQLNVDNTDATDQFDPQFVAIHLDHPTLGTLGVYDPGIDPQYIDGTNNPVLDGRDPALDRTAVFVLNDIPAGLVAGDLGISRLDSASLTGTGAPGTDLPGAGEGGVDAMLGLRGGQSSAPGTYQVTDLSVQLVKSVTIDDGAGGALPVPGAIMTYSIQVNVLGTGNVDGLQITDTIPVSTTYVAESIRVDAAVRTDAADADNADFNSSFPGGVFVDLATVAGGTTFTITFQVTID